MSDMDAKSVKCDGWAGICEETENLTTIRWNGSAHADDPYNHLCPECLVELQEDDHFREGEWMEVNEEDRLPCPPIDSFDSKMTFRSAGDGKPLWSDVERNV